MRSFNYLLFTDMNKLTGFALAVLILTATACSSKKEENKSAPGGGAAAGRSRNMPMSVEGYVVNTSTVSESIEVPGNVLPFESTELHPEVSGRVVSLNINEGSYVRKGTVLAKLFDGDLQAQLKKLQVQLSIAERTVQRLGELLKIQGVSQQEYDLSTLEANNIRADIDIIRTNIGRTVIRAPFNGRIGLKNISLGAYVTPQTIIATIQQVDQLKLEFTVPEKYTSRVNVGQTISFTVEGSNKNLLARVMATEGAVVAENRSLQIRAVVMGKDPKLIPGAFAKVNLDFGKDENAMLVPTQAVIPGARNKQVIIYKDGKANFTVVTTGVRDSAMVQLVDGVKVGDTIITTGLLAVKPNAPVKIARIRNKDGRVTPVASGPVRDSTTRS
jgi:membrane fusion protein, multidrug efflux system